MPKLEALGVTIPNEVRNDCDPGDKSYITNATALQSNFPPGSELRINFAQYYCI